ncbi:hypothetical protein [Sphingobium lactosutens]|uniref:hypothetical protein n=1 Tax=Sphingobium lactosutens TaxID=522773 RepID=UPI0015BFFC57|nr:hypothetical protein [Sphingobium lactosutens]
MLVKFIIDLRKIEAFDRDDIKYFQYCAAHWMCDRIVKRAEPMGWDLVRREDAEHNCERITFKASDGAPPLSKLLISLHWSGFPIKPQHMQLDCDKPDA